VAERARLTKNLEEEDNQVKQLTREIAMLEANRKK
jgi:hypothetical protein